MGLNPAMNFARFHSALVLQVQVPGTENGQKCRMRAFSAQDSRMNCLAGPRSALEPCESP